MQAILKYGGDGSAAKAMVRHILKVAPKSTKVLFENAEVRVIEITMGKDRGIPMHCHDKGLSYSLNGGKIRSTDENGKSRVSKVKKGELSWSNEGESHAVENLGGTLRELSIELKG